ncbi:MAG: FecR domain-containing protein [Alphaproteobacteria bacterium]|nr:FecR domain-containing protein [Alphaproteobacteria bacterium]MCB9793980.1 FecR domain-containing protein [Alphaproteobacteria bacterium]
MTPGDDLPTLDPTEAELERVLDVLSPEDMAPLAQATAPTAAEIARLRPRARALAPPQRRLAPVMLVAVAAALLLALLWPREPAPVFVALGAHQVLDTPLSLGPDIQVEHGGPGEVALSVLAAGPEGAVVEVTEGAATFEVDPAGQYRDLEVRAGSLRVRVTGTRFTVHAEGRVEVHRGSVEVLGEGLRTALRAGDAWPPVAVEALDHVVQRLADRESAEAALDAELEDAPELRAPAPVAPVQQRAVPPEAAHEELMSESEAEAFEALLLARAERDPSLGPLAEDFLRRWGDSPLGPEVEAIALSAALPSAEPLALLARVDAWLAENPDHPRFVELHYLRATLLRDRLRDCQRASVSYRVVAELGDPTRASMARRYLEACGAEGASEEDPDGD